MWFPILTWRERKNSDFTNGSSYYKSALSTVTERIGTVLAFNFLLKYIPDVHSIVQTQTTSDCRWWKFLLICYNVLKVYWARENSVLQPRVAPTSSSETITFHTPHIHICPGGCLDGPGSVVATRSTGSLISLRDKSTGTSQSASCIIYSAT